MLTTDPLYYRPLLPVIAIKNTANNTILYTYNSFTDTGTTDKVLYCSVSLSQNTHGEFTIQFEDQNKSLESTVTVGSRVQIDCGKQSTSLTRLISGIVRKKGYSRGANNKVLYTISGSSTGIRLNELLSYAVSEARKAADGITPDKTDISRKADTLLAANLNQLTADGILSISNLAVNSDVETFIADLRIEFGELQDLANYISNQSGGEVVVDTTDLVNFRYEIKNTFFGRGFTIKNWNDNKANDDADDTMYLRGKNWSYEDDFYKSNDYASSLTAILQADPRPSNPADLGVITSPPPSTAVSSSREIAAKFRPTHTRFIPGDIYMALIYWSFSSATLTPFPIIVRVCEDTGGLPQDANGIVASIVFSAEVFPDPLPNTGVITDNVRLVNEGFYVNNFTGQADDFYLDTTKDYWLILTNSGITGDERVSWCRNELVTGGTTNMVQHTANFSTSINGGSSWTTIPNTYAFAMGRYRSMSLSMWDPKAIQATQSGLTNGLKVESLIQDAPIQTKTTDSMYRRLSGELYDRSRPKTIYNFPSVISPNIPPFPGDPIVISDTILGLSTIGNPVVLTTCGDMTYQWGNLGSGGYEAPTILNINAIGVHSRYR